MLKRGQIVRSRSGHDKESFLVVLECDGKFAAVCDGNRRKLDKPKKKNVKHLAASTKILPEEELGTDRKIRTALKQYPDIMEC